jgi:hypothetical protein
MRKFAGESYVIEELRKLELDPELLVRKGNQAPEIKVSNKIVQVRTRKNAIPGWVLHSKAEKLSSDNFFYAFVNLDENSKPIIRIVPSKEVATSVYNDHQKWLKGQPKIVSNRKDTPMRKFYDTEGKYINAWHLLK